MVRKILLTILLLTAASCGTEEDACAQALLFSDDFDGGAATGWDELFFTDSHYTPTTAESKYVTTPASPTGSSHVIHYYALINTNEVNVVKLQHDFVSGDESEVYAIWHEYFAADYPFPSTSQKMLRLFFYDESFPASRKEITVVVSQENLYVDYSFACGLWGDSSLCNVDFAENTGATPHPTNQWVEWKLWVKLNTPGDTDGFIRLYRNDVLDLSNESVDLRGTDTKGFNSILFGMNYSMAGGDGNLPSSGSRYIGTIQIYDGEPAAEGGGGDPVPGPQCSASRQKDYRRLNRGRQ